ncbi:MAG: TIGR00159 family protein [Verrucomicrobia bacterium]|nr:TIGR00159 family protein [Verrucomicrobiota bacterium]
MDFELLQRHWRSGVEIFVLSLVIYFILRFIRGTRGARVLLGLVLLLLLLTVISQAFALRTISWLLGHFFAFIVVALVVIFQPELRRALAEVGSQSVFLTISRERDVVDVLVKTALSFSARKIGALIAIEREIGVRGTAEAGAVLDARLSYELLDQIFFPNSPLHDGGVIVQNDRIVSAACIFPLTQRTDLAKSVGTRHRAAMGMAEETDAVLLVISEETGNISVACQNELYQNLDGEQLHTLLTRLLVGVPRASWIGKLRGMFASRKA